MWCCLLFGKSRTAINGASVLEDTLCLQDYGYDHSHRLILNIFLLQNESYACFLV